MEKVKENKDIVSKVLFWSMIGMIILFCATCFIPFLNDNKIFSDFAETLSYCISQNPYTGVDGIHAIYPPFAFLPFYLFALICKAPLQNYLEGSLTLTELVKEPTYIVSFLLFFAICLALILFLTVKISKFKGKKLVYLLVTVALFAPIFYSFCRGNNIVFAVIFAMLFFWLYNSEKRWQREIANLCLACAIAVKIYPIIIVIFFIKDRRFLDLLKTIVYALVLLFLPFLLIQGGFYNISHIWNNFTGFNSSTERAVSWTNISINALFSKLSYLSIPASFISILSSIVKYSMIIMSIVALALSKKSKQMMQCVLISLLTYALFMDVSYAYTLTFLIIPLTMYFANFNDLSKLNKIYYGVCFAVIACPISASTYVLIFSSLAGICLIVKAYIDLISEFVKSRKPKLPNAVQEVFVDEEETKKLESQPKEKPATNGANHKNA